MDPPKGPPSGAHRGCFGPLGLRWDVCALCRVAYQGHRGDMAGCGRGGLCRAPGAPLASPSGFHTGELVLWPLFYPTGPQCRTPCHQSFHLQPGDALLVMRQCRRPALVQTPPCQPPTCGWGKRAFSMDSQLCLRTGAGRHWLQVGGGQSGALGSGLWALGSGLWAGPGPKAAARIYQSVYCH